MYLMCGEKEIAFFDFENDRYEVYDENLLPYSLRGKFSNIPSGADEITKKEVMRQNYHIMEEFLAKRVLSLDRKNAKKLYNAYKFSQSQDNGTKAKIALVCKALSMTDSYWINDDNKSFKWEEINVRTNKLNKIVSNIMLFGKSLTATGLPHTPELTGKGNYAQAWVRKNDGLWLYKCATSEKTDEAKIEASVSKILDCFNVPHVEYKYINLFQKEDPGKNIPSTKCRNMSNEDYCMVPAEDVYTYCDRNGLDYNEFVLSIDTESIDKMNIVDYLISNADRHSLNWGFYMSNETGDLLCCHPLFDHNNAFDKQNMKDKDGGESLVFEGSKQKYAVIGMKRTGLECTKPLRRDMFPSDEAYDSFMKRAVELGLYKEQKRSLKSFFSKSEQYIPVQLHTEKAVNYNEIYRRNKESRTGSESKSCSYSKKDNVVSSFDEDVDTVNKKYSKVPRMVMPNTASIEETK